MKKILTATVAAAAMSMFIGGAQAADMDYERAIQGLVVSGKVEQWIGYTFLSNTGGNFDPQGDSYFVSGTSGRLSIPLSDAVAIQMDGDLEYTENAFSGPDDFDTFEASGQGGLHLSYRNTGSFLLGGFAAAGTGRDDYSRSNFFAAGGEAQFYVNDLTFYVQGGHLSATSGSNGQTSEDSLHNAFFARGVARWFITPESRLQAEVSYANGDQDTDNKDMDIVEWGVRYDTVLAGLPIIGETPVFVAYRGANFDNGFPAGDTGKFTDHTIMVGTSYSFGGNSMQEFDRVGATLDLPNFGRWVISGSSLD